RSLHDALPISLAENVFITAEKARKLRDVPRSVKYSLQISLALSTLFCAVGCWLLLASEYPAVPNGEGVSGSTVLREMNLARQDPALYATYVEALRSRFDGRFIIFPGSAKWRMKEGLGAIEEAVRFLRNARPEQPLTLSPGMRPIIAPIRLRGARDMAAATGAARAIASAAMESGGDCGVKTLPTEKRARAKSFLRSLLTMAA